MRVISHSSPKALKEGACLVPFRVKIEAFLTHLAVEGNVATATQNQAMNALVFLYKRVPPYADTMSTPA
jgi:hypothetical protein